MSANNTLNIKCVDSPDEAPNYNDDLTIRGINIDHVLVVGKGMQSGLATVDFVLETQDGDKFMFMITGTLLKNLVSVIEGVEARTIG